MDLSKFHVISVISNPVRYNSRYALYNKFKEDCIKKMSEEVLNAGAQFWTLELASGARLHKITEKSDPQAFQIQATSINSDIWLKENMMNLAINRLTERAPDWRYVAWIDADVKFEQGFMAETVQGLQHWDIVQMFSHVVDLDSGEKTLAGVPGVLSNKIFQSYMYCYWNNIDLGDQHPYAKGGHPGFAWAARRESLNKLGTSFDNGPFLSFAILGGADRVMAASFIGNLEGSFDHRVHPPYRKYIEQYFKNAKALKRNCGYIHGLIRHGFHGHKVNRQYMSRWAIFDKYKFNPETDLRRDVSGIWQLVLEEERQFDFRDACRKYFIERNEDAI